MSISWVDIVVGLLALMAAVSGWRHGLAVALLSFLGVLGGALLGIQLAPLIVRNFDTTASRVVVSILVVVLLIGLGETVGVVVGGALRDRMNFEGIRVVDSTLGSVLQAMAAVVVAWLVALPLASASYPTIASGVRHSAVLRGVNAVMPPEAKQLPAQLRRLLDSSGFPDVLSPFSATPITDVGPPDQALVDTAAVSRAERSVVKIQGQAPSCSRALEGSGFVIAPQRVMTNAHVVAGTDTVDVIAPTSDRELSARVVLYDPEVDVAILAVPDLSAPTLPFASQTAGYAANAVVLGYPLNGPLTATAAKVRERINLRGPDIYDSGIVTRDVYTIRAVVRSGNSGGPLIDPQGGVDGVVFGAAVDDSQTGFVLTAQEVSSEAGQASSLGQQVETGTCAA